MGLRIGRYETLCEIASGGMATVHLARAVGVGGFERRVAIKVMHAHIANDPEFVNMFLDEARLAARIHHPNVVSTIDVQKDDEQRLFLVMDYVEGPSLSGLLSALRKANMGLSLDITLRIFLDALAGLHAAHELTGPEGEPLHLVHRDVSPQNILVGADGVARITDFGVAHAEARLSSTRGGQVKGKLAYMAPEQILSEKIDRRCDIYAAGVVLWTLLTGEKYIQAENEGAIIHKILEGPKETVRKRNPEIPAPIDAVCTCALAVDQNDRHETAAAFAEALEEAAAASGIPVANPRAVAALLKTLKPFLALPHVPGAASASKSIRRPPSLPPPQRSKSAVLDPAFRSVPPAPIALKIQNVVSSDSAKREALHSSDLIESDGNVSLPGRQPANELSVGPSTVDSSSFSQGKSRLGIWMVVPVALLAMAIAGTGVWVFKDNAAANSATAASAPTVSRHDGAGAAASVASRDAAATDPPGTATSTVAPVSPALTETTTSDAVRTIAPALSRPARVEMRNNAPAIPHAVTPRVPKAPAPSTATTSFQPSVL